jgi:hypothetical protein
MQFRSTILGLAGAALAAGTALADPTTYVGKLDKLDIVVEFTGDPGAPSGPLAARYHYRSQGADIPLQAKSQKGAAFELSEEEACKEACVEGKPGPVGAVWSLIAKNGGQTLEGKWKAGKKSFDLKLERAGVRSADTPPVTPLDLYNFSVESFYQTETPITIESSPYDFLRLDVPYDAGEKQGWPDANFVYVTDPRTKFQRPRIFSLAGGAKFDAANDLLEDRQWVDNIAALGCKSLQYAGFQQYGPVPGGSDGTLGYYDETSSEVLALTPKLISWRESGSIFCGGAHPTNYSDTFVMDVANGEVLSLADMFINVTEEGEPGEILVKFVRETREKPTDQVDIDFEAECGTDELIGQYLDASLKREGNELRIVFGLSGLPHVIAACGDDFLSLPAADVQHLLEPEFADLLAK